MNAAIEALLRRAVQVFTAEGLRERLASGRTLKIKLGADPSRPDLHLGHSVVLRALRVFQDLGHEVIFVVGDFTAMIGDPSGRSRTRPALSLAETRRAGETYFRQAVKILDEKRTRIEFNSTWLSRLEFEDVLKLAATHTVARILERDDFRRRHAAHQPIGVHELLYPLLQGYDSVALEADVEIGGTDQIFNLLVGRELQNCCGRKPQEVITFPLLPGLDGMEKMSKSLGNCIGLDEPPERMFEKAMRIPDPLLPDYYRLTTDLPAERIDSLIAGGQRTAHLEYGREIVRMYHGPAAVEPAVARYLDIAGGIQPESLNTFTLSRRALSDGAIGILDALIRVGFAASKSEARRLIEGKGVRIGNEVITDIGLRVDLSEDRVLQYGKNRFVRLTTERPS